MNRAAGTAEYQDARAVKVPTRVFASNQAANRHVAGLIAALVRQRKQEGRRAVLGLATGSTPMGVYRELIRFCEEDGLDLSDVVTFNLDEYYPMTADREQSYRHWMNEVFFKPARIPLDQTNLPDGSIPRDRVERYCAEYERKIAEAGGIDIQLLGVGRTGHIGFNEPGSTIDSRTRLVTLDPVTRKDAASDFYGEANVPHQAITMGVGSILSARQVIIMAFGEHKASIVREATEGRVTENIAASFLQEHDNAQFVLDLASAAKLTAFETPWLLGPVDWSATQKKRALIWLSLKLKKALLKLQDDDLREHGLHELLREHGPAQRLAQETFHALQASIASVPGGETGKRVVVFSPHPDDDVISMGGTLLHLVQHKNDVHVAYMTSGNIAVFDHDVERFVDFICRFNRMFEIDEPRVRQLQHEMAEHFARKQPGDLDSPASRSIKGLIRETEAISAATSLGVRHDHLHFLALPFYETGAVKKNPISNADVLLVERLLREIRPHEIFVAGDLSDPHGTHRVCAEAIFAALRRIPAADQPIVWLYRGAWQEWEPHEIDRAVPLTPEDIMVKREAIFRHESQKDEAMFPGPYDAREFWERAEGRNRHTADLYNQLGLPEYYAMEGFVRWSSEHPL